MKDTIRLSSITLQATHGCYDHEKVTPQTFIIDVECVLDFLLDKSDELTKTLNYELIRTAVFETFKQSPINLIETLAVEVSEKLLDMHSVSEVMVKIAKPDIWDDCTPSVEVRRSKQIL